MLLAGRQDVRPAAAQPMPPGRPLPLLTQTFQVEFGNHLRGIFNAVSGLGSETVVIEQRMAGERGTTTTVLIPGPVETLVLQLARRVSRDADLWAWRQLVVDGRVGLARASGTITLLDQAGAPVASWEVQNAWPSRLAVSTTADGVIEELDLVYEQVQRSR